MTYPKREKYPLIRRLLLLVGTVCGVWTAPPVDAIQLERDALEKRVSVSTI